MYCVCSVGIIQGIGINGVYLGKHICAAENVIQKLWSVKYTKMIDLLRLNEVVIDSLWLILPCIISWMCAKHSRRNATQYAVTWFARYTILRYYEIIFPW